MTDLYDSDLWAEPLAELRSFDDVRLVCECFELRRYVGDDSFDSGHDIVRDWVNDDRSVLVTAVSFTHVVQNVIVSRVLDPNDLDSVRSVQELAAIRPQTPASARLLWMLLSQALFTAASIADGVALDERPRAEPSVADSSAAEG